MRNGNAHNSNVPAKIMPWLRKSTEFRRRHRTSAEEPAYFCLPASIPRRTRCRTLGRSSVVIAALLLPPRPAGYAAGHIEPPDQARASRVVGGAFAGARGLRRVSVTPTVSSYRLLADYVSGPGTPMVLSSPAK